MTLTPEILIDWLSKGGLLALMAVIIWGGQRDPPLWVYGREYASKAQECEMWRLMALRSLGVADKAYDTTRTAVTSFGPLADPSLFPPRKDRSRDEAGN